MKLRWAFLSLSLALAAGDDWATTAPDDTGIFGWNPPVVPAAAGVPEAPVCVALDALPQQRTFHRAWGPGTTAIELQKPRDACLLEQGVRCSRHLLALVSETPLRLTRRQPIGQESEARVNKARRVACG